jgi:signal transduction histidine kinase
VNRQEWATELAESKILHDISTQLIHERRTELLYQKIVDAAATITHSDFASIQMYWPERGVVGELQLLAFRGFTAKAARFWEWVRIDSASSCGEALRQLTRIVVPDVKDCKFLAGSHDLAVYLQTGIRAVQTTPLISREGTLVGMLSTHWSEPHTPLPRELEFLDILACQAADLIERKRVRESLEAQVRQRTAEITRAHASVRALSMKLMKAQDEERRRVARELHDGIGQIAVAAGFVLGEAKDRTDDPALVRCLSEAGALLDQLSQEIRTTSYLLHPPLLDECGLESAIRWYTEGLAKRTGLSISVSIAEDLGRLPAELEMAAFRIVQECLTNIHRHSGSKTARIVVERDADSALLRIEDDGRGIPPEVLNQTEAAQAGVGLAGMRERVHHLNGAMQIDSSPGGTKVQIAFAVATEGRALGMSSSG